MQTAQENEVIEACRRLGGKNLLRSPSDSFSVRIAGSRQALLATGCDDWRPVQSGHLRTTGFSAAGGVDALHELVYRLRPDVNAIVVCSPPGVRLLARFGGVLPPLFDEQVRHLGLLKKPPKKEEGTWEELLTSVLRRGVNAVQMGEQAVCLGADIESAVNNLELYEKCSRAYVLARASGYRFRCIPGWVRWIAVRRLLKEQRSRQDRFAAL
ncbi:MAG: class II aldolase/adducin family protein [Terracidiphilus sp.]